jgi:hypothetical protein
VIAVFVALTYGPIAAQAVTVTLGAARDNTLYEDLASRDFLGFWPTAFVSYTACGLAAGVISAPAWFRASSRTAK